MTAGPAREGVYGAPAADLVEVGAGAVQFSPLMPGSAVLEAVDDGALDSISVAAPAGTIERRYALAQGLRALRPGGRLVALAPKDRGGSRLRADLEGLGCAVVESAKRHQRICRVIRPKGDDAFNAMLAAAIGDGAPQRPPALGLWSQPGIFSWDRVDPGSALLAEALPALSGSGADLGCGVGVLALRALASPAVKALTLIDLDRRAIAAAQRNIDDPRAAFLWADARTAPAPAAPLDFVVMNPPFHNDGTQDHALGQAFIRRAAALLRKGGRCWLVANRHLPYEAVLAEVFAAVTPRGEADGFKVLEAVR